MTILTHILAAVAGIIAYAIWLDFQTGRKACRNGVRQDDRRLSAWARLGWKYQQGREQ